MRWNDERLYDQACVWILRPYQRHSPWSGKAAGVDLKVVAMNDTARMFSGMFRGEYDASEMSLAELLYYASRGKNDFIGIPVFPSRVFRHGFIFYNALSNIHSPQDLEGKKSGFSCLVQTESV